MRRRGGSSRYGKFSITGKSHLAREVAAHIIGCEPDGLKESGQFGFVQFHPSYDYTDFVEGLRPYDEGQGGVGFKLEKGSFMGFVLRQETREPYRRASAVFERPVDVLRRSSRHRPLRRWRSSLAWSWISHVACKQRPGVRPLENSWS